MSTTVVSVDTDRKARTTARRRRILAGSVALLGVVLLLAPSAEGATYYWDTDGQTAGFGGGITGTWGTGNNFWNTDSTGGAGGTLTALPTSSDDLNVSAGTSGTITIGTTGTGSSLTISDNVAVTIAGGTLALGGTGVQSGLFVTSTDTATTTISSALTLNNATVNIVNSGTGVLGISGGITGSKDLVLISLTGTTAGITISGSPVNNAGMITNEGPGLGSVLISGGVGANVTTVNQMSATSELDITTNALTVNSGGTALVNYDGALLMVSGGVSGTGNLILANLIGTAADITISGSPVNNAGVINNEGPGHGSVLISGGVGSNVTAVNQMSSTSELDITTNALTVNSGGTSLVNYNGALLVVSGGVNGTGDLILANLTGTTAGITISGSPVNNVGEITNQSPGMGSVLISGGVGANVTTINQRSATSELDITTNALTVNSGGTTLINYNGAPLVVSGGVNGTGDLILVDLTGTTAGITLSGSPVNNAGAITNQSPAHGSVLISGGVGANVTTVNQMSSTSELDITTNALTVNSGGTKLFNYGGASLMVSGGVNGTGDLILVNLTGTTAGITLSGSPINNTGVITNQSPGPGSVLISGGVGANVTAVNQMSSTSELDITTNALTVNSGGTTLFNYGGAPLVVSGGVNGTGDLILLNLTGTTAGITISGSPINNVGAITNESPGLGSVLISGGVGANVTVVNQLSSNSELDITTNALMVNSGGTTLLNSGGAPLMISGGVNGTGDLLLQNNSSLAAGITISGSPINNTGVINNAGLGSGSVLISGGVGANVTAVNQMSATSELDITTNPLTVNSAGTTLLNSGGAPLMVSGGVNGTGDLLLQNNSSLAAGITLSGSSINNTGAITNAGLGTGSVLISAVIGANVAAVNQMSATSSLTLSGPNIYSSTTSIYAGTLRTQNASALGSGPVAIYGGNLALDTSLNVASVAWNAGTIQLAPAAGTILHATTTLNNGGAGGTFVFDTNGLTVSTYTLATFASSDFTLGDFSVLGLNPNVQLQGQFVLNPASVQYTITGATATGPLLENGPPVGIPPYADFIVNGPVATGGLADNNTINSLIFRPGGTLAIFNMLTVTSGSISQPGGTAAITGGTLIGPNGLHFDVNGNLFVGSTLIGNAVKTGTGSLFLDGTLYGNMSVFQGLLGGNGSIFGNLFNAGIVSPGHSPGRIGVSGNYTQAPSGLLRIEISGTDISEHDLLSVGGTAKLDGTLQLVRLNGFNLKRNQAITFLTANGGVTGRFSMVVNDLTGDTVLQPMVIYGSNSVAVEGAQGSFAALPGLTPNQQSVGRALDSAANDRRANSLFDYLDYRALNKLPGDLDRIAPEELTSVYTLGVSLATVQSLNVQRRTDDIRSGSSGFNAANLALNGDNPSFSGGFGIGNGVAGPNGSAVPQGDDGKEVKETKSVVPAENRWGVFLSGTGEWVSVGNTENARGYDLESGGFTLGVDYKVTPNLAIGLAAGYTGTTADLTNNGRIWVNGGQIGLYGTFFQNEQAAPAPTMSKDASKEAPAPAPSVAKGLYADMAVFGGYNSYDTRRSALQGEARGSTDGGELNVLFGTGYDFKSGGLTFGPTATFNYTYIGTSDFTEHGSLAPLDVHGGKGESLRSALGFKASYDWKIGGIVIKPELRAAWQHEYGDAAYAMDSSFASGAGNSFLVNGPKLGRDSALLGAGFAIQLNERCATYFYYDGELGRTNYQSTNVTGGVRLAF